MRNYRAHAHKIGIHVRGEHSVAKCADARYYSPIFSLLVFNFYRFTKFSLNMLLKFGVFLLIIHVSIEQAENQDWGMLEILNSTRISCANLFWRFLAIHRIRFVTYAKTSC